MKTMQQLHPLNRPRHLARGTSLIEVLVALLVMTLGLLAMISLHTASVRYHKMAEFRSVATQLAEDFGDRMRANLTGVRNGNYVVATPWVAEQAAVPDPGIPCAALGTCAANATAAQVAASDIAQWTNNAVGILPGVGVHAVRPAGAAANSMVMDVWITWLDPGEDATEAAANLSLQGAYVCPATLGQVPAELRCLRYRFTL